MRQRGLTPDNPKGSSPIRRVTLLALACWLALSSLPLATLVVLAAPPEAPIATEGRTQPAPAKEADRNNDAATTVEKPQDAHAPQPAVEPSTVERKSVPAENRSVRPRGLEAPLQLRPKGPDPLDGPVKDKDRDSEPRRQEQDAKAERRRAEERKARNVRVWPMRAERYTFTQAFGCVPQIAHFYQPGAGCPASAPVIHHGVDLAAPEGTPFYAAASGWVTESGYDREVGVANTRIIIQHEARNEDYATEYLHWIASFVEVGDYVEAGEAIGEVGSVGYSTGPHLHFSVIDLNTGGNLDPLRWLPDEPGTEGYRGRRPSERAEMRLPAGTTAGVPEWHDPNPPPPPERQEVPESPGKDRSRGKHKRDRNKNKNERRAEKNENAPGNEAEASANDTGGDGSAQGEPEKTKKGKNKERMRKRERNKNGRQSEKADTGDDGNATSDDGRDKDKGKGKKEKRDRRGGDGAHNGKDRNRDKGNQHQDRAKDDRQKERARNKERNDREKLKPVEPVEDVPEDDEPDGGEKNEGDTGGEDTPTDDNGSDKNNEEPPPDDGNGDNSDSDQKQEEGKDEPGDGDQTTKQDDESKQESSDSDNGAEATASGENANGGKSKQKSGKDAADPAATSRRAEEGTAEGERKEQRARGSDQDTTDEAKPRRRDKNGA